jgi:hypothetical protein
MSIRPVQGSATIKARPSVRRSSGRWAPCCIWVHGRNNIDVTINDHGPYRKGRALDCTPAVDKALHLDGLGSVRVEPYPPLPKARPVEAQALHY